MCQNYPSLLNFTLDAVIFFFQLRSAELLKKNTEIFLTFNDENVIVLSPRDYVV